MEQKKLDRINELAKKAKESGLTADESAEREILRKEYIAEWKANLTEQLDNTYIIEPDGVKHKLGKKNQGNKA